MDTVTEILRNNSSQGLATLGEDRERPLLRKRLPEKMTTPNQQLGEKGERIVAGRCPCPKCKRSGTLKRLPVNFKCADVICDFCGYLAQVKAVSCEELSTCPRRILGAAWSVQKARMDSGIY